MAITKTVRKKFKSFEQEEEWLNELADLGWRLIAFGDDEMNLDYTFEMDSAVEGIHYKIDYRMLKNKAEFEDYMTLFEETGWQPVPCKWNNYKYIFVSAEAKDIFSDKASLIERERQRRKGYFITFSVLFVGDIGCAFWYYFKREDFLPVLLMGYSAALIYFGWKIWGKTKKMKQLRG